MKGTAGCLAEGSKLQIFVSFRAFRAFRTESQYFYESNAVGLCARNLHIKETTLLLSYTEWRICSITKKESCLSLFEKTRVLFVILDNHSPCLVCQMSHKWKLRIVATINVSWNVRRLQNLSVSIRTLSQLIQRLKYLHAEILVSWRISNSLLILPKIHRLVDNSYFPLHSCHNYCSTKTNRS